MTGNQTEQNDLPDRYRIIKCLGTGATGAVFHAIDSTLQRDVAIKVLHQGFAQANVARFQREAQAASRLKHPNVVSVLDFGVHKNSRPYLVMEHLDGIDLQSLLKKERLTPERVCRLFIQLCGALAHANSKDVVHRDIKPSNIIVQNYDGEEQVKIVDFGLARLSDKELSLTAPGVTLGTPYYLSPEVISGQAADARSDIYSIGCVLFECLSGHPPFQGDNINATLMMHTSEEAPSLQDHNVPPGLQQIVSKALEKNPDDRFQTSDQLQSALADELNTLCKPETMEISKTLKPTTGSFNYGNIFHSKSLIKIDSQPQKTKYLTAKFCTVIAIAALAVTLVVPRLLSRPESTNNSQADHGRSEQPELTSKSVDNQKMGTLDDSLGDQVKDVFDNSDTLRISSRFSDDSLISDLHGSKITKIFINDRTITPKLMDEIVSLKNLQTLKFTGVKGLSKDMLSGLEQLPYLSTLYLSDSNLDDSSIQILAKCEKLDALSLDGNRRITGSGLRFLGDNNMLQRIYIGQTGVTKTRLKEFLSHSPANLKNIKISRLKLSDSDIRSLNLRKIQTLDIGYNPITNDTVKYLRTACPNLHHLVVTGCSELTDGCLAALPEGLETVSLTGTGVGTLAGISKTKSLKEVYLDRCSKIGDIAMAELGQMNLAKVSLKDTNVTDHSLKSLVAHRDINQKMTINLQRCPNVSKLEVAELKKQNIKVHTGDDDKSRDEEF